VTFTATFLGQPIHPTCRHVGLFVRDSVSGTTGGLTQSETLEFPEKEMPYQLSWDTNRVHLDGRHMKDAVVKHKIAKSDI
jgi:hypothetical protein